ncbi:hypothetical protein IFM89_008540 [Coptis chinensis]|uniref:Amidase domain-containing protein n=1 Tax=Coptis chinensis TaxID=261450 RepID=A0A835HWI4_9MAGN|nr:hypothetical protein IFM89_008540 [Coptis chinensis]
MVHTCFDVKDYVTGFGNPDWKKTHEAAGRTAAAVSCLLKNGATCVGKTVMDELAFGITGENMHYGTPTNPDVPAHVPGGSSSGSAVVVAAQLVDFSLGTDTVGCVRTPASFCGILGFRASHGLVSTVGLVANSQSLDAIGWFARDPSVFHHVGHVLLPASRVEVRRGKRLIFADDCFQFMKAPKQKSMHVVVKASEILSGYQPPQHMNIGQHIAKNVPSLKEFTETANTLQQGTSTLKALSNVMILLQSIGGKEDGILVIPTIPDFPLKLDSGKHLSSEFLEKAFVLLSIAGMSGCCQATLPLGKHDGCPLSISFIASHGKDKFLLDTILDIYPSLQEQVGIASNSLPLPDTNGDMDTSELLKEKVVLLQGNAAFKGKQWNKAVKYYSEAIKLSENATYFCNRAAAYLELGCFQQSEADCSQAIILDKKNVKAYLRRGTAREMLLCYKEAAQDFKHALVLEPQNKVANLAEKRLRKLAN